ncbi:MAG TPA: hypothetical protein VKU00_04610 [Chthonomonadaceae bacterium]|nr:hypothetical protein [Chthonomonadaceae bacterium]
MSKTRLMLILLAVCVVLGGGYAIYLLFSIGFNQEVAPQVLSMLALILLVGGITWFVYKSEK